jgi:iron complex outermembrane receptor protein
MCNGLMRVAFLACLAVSVSLPAMGAGNETVMDEVVVSATRTEKEVGDVAASVTVITAQDLAEQKVTTVDDAIKHAEGVYVRRQNGIASSIPTVTLRGLSGQDRTLIMQNGLPLNDGYNGGVFWNNLSVENIERIEVIRGPASALYGGNAMGGVVNIITKMPEQLEGGIRLGAGNHDTIGGTAWVGDKRGSLSYRLSMEGRGTQGYPTLLVYKGAEAGTSTNTGARDLDTTTGEQYVVGDKGDKKAGRYNVNTSLAWDLPEDGSIRLDLMRGYTMYFYKSPHTYITDAAGNEVWNGKADLGDGRRTKSFTQSNFLSGRGGETIHMASLTLEKDLWDTAFTAKTGLTHSDRWYTTPKGKTTDDYHDTPGVLTPSDRWGMFVDLQDSIALTEDHLLTVGAYFRRDTFEQKERTLEDYLKPETDGDVTNITQGKMHQYALFAQDEWQVTDSFSLTPGIRVDMWEGFDGASGKVGAVNELDDVQASAVSPKLSALWKVLPDTSLRAAVGQAFRPPNIYEMYRDWVSDAGTYYVSNPNLDPETVRSIELGVDQYLFDRTLRASVTAFHSRLYDAIGTKTIDKAVSDSGLTEKHQINYDEAKVEGVESSLVWTPVSWLELSTTYTVNYTKILKNDADPASEDHHMTDVPEDVWNLSGTLRSKYASLNVSGTRIGRIYTDTANDLPPDVYGGYSRKFLVDTRLVFTPVEHWAFSLSVDNVLDEKVYMGSSVAPGREYFLEVGYTF